MRGLKVVDFCDVKTTTKFVEEERFDIIWKVIWNFYKRVKPEMVMIEAAIGGSTTQHATHGLNAIVRYGFYRHDVLFETMAPNTLKKAATGDGHASKPDMEAAARVNWPECPHHDCADAYFLAIEAAKVRVEGV